MCELKLMHNEKQKMDVFVVQDGGPAVLGQIYIS